MSRVAEGESEEGARLGLKFVWTKMGRDWGQSAYGPTDLCSLISGVVAC